jgi:hypothetical protein
MIASVEKFIDFIGNRARCLPVCSILPQPIMALELTQPITEMSNRYLPGDKGRPARKADNLTAIFEQIVWKMWEPRRLSRFYICVHDISMHSPPDREKDAGLPCCYFAAAVVMRQS